jgi:hypothetical protein
MFNVRQRVSASLQPTTKRLPFLLQPTLLNIFEYASLSDGEADFKFIIRMLPDSIFNIRLNKKFWEELIAYFPRYDTGHIGKDASNNSSTVACAFVTTRTFLPSRCLATIREFLTIRCLATIRGFLPIRCLQNHV